MIGDYLFGEGDKVRLIRNVRNDGTYPNRPMGELLMERGSVGYVIDIGTFLQDQIIYSIHFLDKNMIIGCREEELIDSEVEWYPSRFQFRDKVVALKPLAVQGKIAVEIGEIGEIQKVIPNDEQKYLYHVYFKGRTLQLPETLLAFAETTTL